MSIAPEAPITPRHAGYYELPKDIGEVLPDDLLDIAHYNADQAASLPRSAAVRFHAVAGSAYVEASLVGATTGHDVDRLLAQLDRGEAHLREATVGEYHFLESGFKRPDNQVDWLRAQLQCDFMTVYRDIVCGAVSEQTRNEMIALLSKRLRYVEKLDEPDYHRGAREGLAYELKVLLRIWQAYRQTGDMVTFPSSIRGGNGEMRPKETHDIAVAYREGTTWRYSGVEVKGGKGLNLAALARYLHPVMHIRQDGSIQEY